MWLGRGAARCSVATFCRRFLPPRRRFYRRANTFLFNQWDCAQKSSLRFRWRNLLRRLATVTAIPMAAGIPLAGDVPLASSS